MSKDVRSLVLILGLPFAAAALLLAAGAAWRSLAPSTVYAQGAGVDSREGYALTTLDVGGGVHYLCVSSHAQYGKDPTPRQFLTFYELRRTGQGAGELHLVGSRCIEYDRGFAELGFKSARGYKPTDLERELEKSRRAGGKPPQSNEPPASND